MESIDKLKISELENFDITEYLDDEEAIAEYLSIMAEEEDASLLMAALGDIARARGMTQVAKEAGMNRESLYKALRVGSHPQFDTVKRVGRALGFQVSFSPVSQ